MHQDNSYIRLIWGRRTGSDACQPSMLERRQPTRRAALVRRIALAASLVVLGATGYAQISTGAINGTVRDNSGAVIADANVTLTNSDTGVQRTTRTTRSGSYSLTEVSPGNYSLSTEKQGFSIAERKGIVLTVNQTLTFDETLALGSVTQTVTIQANTANVDVSTAANGTVIGTKQVQALPLNGRNFTQLLTLTPGAVSVNVDQNASNSPNSFLGTRIGTVVFPAINGQGNRSNLFVVDGLNDQGVMGANYAVAPILDDIQEFKVQSLNDESMFGGVTGGIVNVVTKSGTNEFHGVGWEFFRNSALDARNPFFAKVTELHQNQFGGNIGGPVLLPRYNGRNKTFFFLSYEQYHQTLGGQNLYSVPTAAELSGDLSDQKQAIYNPFTTRPDPARPGQYIRDVFPNNQIPKNLIDPGMLTLAQTLFPTPVPTAVAGFNALDTTPTSTTQYQGSGRVNEQINENNSIWFRYTRYDLPIQAAGGFLGLIEPIEDRGWNYGFSYLHTFSPTTLVQAQFGRTYDVAISGSSYRTKPADIFQKIGFANSFVCGFVTVGCLVPTLTVPGFLTGGESYNSDGQSDFYQYSADFTKILRNHTIKTGYAFYPTQFDAIKAYNNLGFNTPQTANPENSGKTGNALASLLLGIPDNATYRNSTEAERNGKIMGAYFEDQWKATRSLTINVGLRDDLTLLPPFGLASNRTNAIGDLNLNNGTYLLQVNPGSCATVGSAPCIPGGLPQSHVAVSSNGKIFQNQYDNVQPRIGFAYALDGKTAVHGAFGIFFDNWANFQQLNQNIAGTWPSVQLATISNLNLIDPTVTAENPLPGGATLPPASAFVTEGSFADPNFMNAKSDQWIFGFERQLSSDTTVTVNYVGNTNTRLWLRKRGNTAPVPGPGAVAPRTPYSYIQPSSYDTSLGSGNYNALQVSLNRRYSSGLSYLVAYTWAKSMDVGCSDRENCSVQDPYNLETNRSVSTFDLPHVLSTSIVYDLPFGPNRRFRTGIGFVNQLIGNWQVNTILSLTSGLPFTLVTAGDIANTGNSGNYERLNRIGNLSLPNRSKAEWFNTAAVAVPQQYTYGNLGRNALRADWFKNDDLSLFRSFPIGGERSIEFRAEMFNFTNTPTWSAPGSNISVAHFGQVTSTYSTSREIQFALKIHY